MNWPIKAPRPVAAALWAAATFFSVAGCEKPNNIGVELPGTAAITTAYRDYAVTAATVRLDSLPTLKADRLLAGRLLDGNTGIATAASFYSNLQIQTADSLLPAAFDNVQLDSLVLSVAFDRLYGNSTTPARFDVYQLAQKLDERTAYTSASAPALGSVIATNVAGALNRTVVDTATTVGAVPTNVARLALARGTSSAFANSLFTLLKDPTFTQTKLDAFWKGYAVVPSAGYSGAVLKVDPNRTGFILYYHDSKNRARVYLLVTSFSSLSDARYFTRVASDFSGAGPLARLAVPGQAVPAAATNGVTYLQDGNGLATKLEIPGLRALRDTAGVTVNRAELLVPVQPFSSSLFPNPAQTYIYEANANGRILERVVNGVPTKRLIQANDQSQQTQYINPQNGAPSQAVGTLYTLDASNTYYSTLVTSYVQAYLLNQLGGEQPASYILSPTLSLPQVFQPALGLTLNRAALDGNGIKLRIYFSRTNN